MTKLQAPLKFQKPFLKYAKDTSDKLLPISQCRKTLQGIRIRFKNHILPNCKHKKLLFEKHFLNVFVGNEFGASLVVV